MTTNKYSTDEQSVFCVKSQYALNVTRIALKPFVNRVVEQFLEDALDDIRKTTGIPRESTCTSCCIQNVLPCKTKGICYLKNDQCKFHEGPTKHFKPCPRNICHHLRDRIKKSHRYTPSWKNTDSSKWCEEAFEVCKCYMSPEGYEDVTSFDETDFNGTINILINHKGFQEEMDDDLSRPDSICCKAREVGRKVRHSNLRVTEAEFSSYIDILVQLLSDKKYLRNNHDAQEACHKLNQLKTSAMFVKEDSEIFKRVIEELRIGMHTEAMSTKLIEVERSLNLKSEEELHTIIEFRSDLIKYYRSRHSTFPISPLHENTDERIVELYVQPNMYVISPYGRIKVHNYHELFHEKVGNKQNPKELQEIYITSASGIGKTSYGKRMIMAWCQVKMPLDGDNHFFDESDLAEMSRFSFAFYIQLRDIKLFDSYVDDMILHDIIPNLAEEHKYKAPHFLSNILKQNHCLVFLDGLDEYTNNENTVEQTSKIPKRKARTKTTYITTTRPWQLENVSLLKMQIQRKAEIGGLSEKSSNKLIELVLGKLNDLNGTKKSPDAFQDELKERKLQGFKYIPIVLLQLLCLWYAGKPLGRSQCEVYSNMLEFLFNRARKYNPDTTMWKDSQRAQTVLPGCFRRNENCKKNEKVLLLLGKLSFYCLFTGSRDSPYVFDKSDILSYISEEELQFCQKLGLITLVKGENPLLNQEQSFSFLHQSYQEFLAGLYISTASRKATCEILSDKCRSVADIVEKATVFTVVCGLCPDGTSYLSSTISAVRAKDPYIEQYLSGIDHGDTILKRLQFVILDCLQESYENDHDNKLFVEYFFIGGRFPEPSHRVRNLKRMLMDRKTVVKAISIDTTEELTANMLQIIESITNVKKISIHNCENSCSVQRLLRGSTKTLSCLQLRSVQLDEDILTAMGNCRTLRSFCVWDVRVTREVFGLLARYLSANTKLKQIEVRCIECADGDVHGHINLSSHTELETFDMFDTYFAVKGISIQKLKFCSIHSLPRSDLTAEMLLMLKDSPNLQHLICTHGVHMSVLNQVIETLKALKHLEVRLETHQTRCYENDPESSIQIPKSMSALETIKLRNFKMTTTSFQHFFNDLLCLEQRITVHLEGQTFISTDDFLHAKGSIETNQKCCVFNHGLNGESVSFQIGRHLADRQSVANEQSATVRQFSAEKESKDGTTTTNNDSGESRKLNIRGTGLLKHLNAFNKMLFIILVLITMILLLWLTFSDTHTIDRDL